MIRPKSLQQRLAFYMLLPVAILLFAMGFAGFVYARNALLAQWQEASILKLQRSAHQVDMRLSRPKEWMKMFHATAGKPDSASVRQSIVEQLKGLDGVARVELTWMDQAMGGTTPLAGPGHSMGAAGHAGEAPDQGMMRFHTSRISQITPPRYDSVAEHETVSLISDLNDGNGRTVGRLEVAIRFEYLVEHIIESSWWKSQKAFLVDEDGQVLTCTLAGKREQFCEEEDPISVAMSRDMKEKPFGTVMGQGHPADEVGGFVRLHEAPWTLVVIAPGKEILAPIIRFRAYYFITGSAFILFILLLIRGVTGRTVASIRNVSEAAQMVARGDYSALLPVKTTDEVGELIRSFNTMVLQLEERIRLKKSMELAMEVQQNLLPHDSIRFQNLDIAGKSIYCHETGGDYYDFLQFPELGPGRMAVTVGDVVGHGLSAALLMTTVRALLRGRMTQPGDLSQIISDVNRHLCLDTEKTGNFMTLFLMMIDTVRSEIRWVRAGHDPAIVYDPETDTFQELNGEGIVLGAYEKVCFPENRSPLHSRGQIILIGTDGIWETENPAMEKFGKDRVRQLIRNQSGLAAQGILQAIEESLEEFRKGATQKDDVTMVVIKMRG